MSHPSPRYHVERLDDGVGESIDELVVRYLNEVGLSPEDIISISYAAEEFQGELREFALIVHVERDDYASRRRQLELAEGAELADEVAVLEPLPAPDGERLRADAG